jgi:hypothetical protein
LGTLALSGAALAVVVLPGAALAKDPTAPSGTPVKVIVHDDAERPVPTAVVRHAQEADRHRVNSVDGSWEASVLYMPDGTELRFAPRMTVELEISAPGFVTQVLSYQVRRRKNVVEVSLVPLVMDDTTLEEPPTGFGRDEPREPAEGEP